MARRPLSSHARLDLFLLLIAFQPVPVVDLMLSIIYTELQFHSIQSSLSIFAQRHRQDIRPPFRELVHPSVAVIHLGSTWRQQTNSLRWVRCFSQSHYLIPPHEMNEKCPYIIRVPVASLQLTADDALGAGWPLVPESTVHLARTGRNMHAQPPSNDIGITILESHEMFGTGTISLDSHR